MGTWAKGLAQRLPGVLLELELRGLRPAHGGRGV